MKIESQKLIYFSPTGTTKKVVENIAKGTGLKVTEDIDFTSIKNRKEGLHFGSELVIIGAPVYSGRIPIDALNLLKSLKAENTPAILVVVYGYRAYDLALIELKEVAESVGFKGIAAAAFIGEHSFATKELPIANDRPDSDDVTDALEFGSQVINSLESVLLDNCSLEVPGTLPLPERQPFPIPIVPETSDNRCTLCGICAEVCPNSAISRGNSKQIDADRCIKCCACIKECPEDAKRFNHEMFNKISAQLSDLATSGERKEAEVFYCN